MRYFLCLQLFLIVNYISAMEKLANQSSDITNAQKNLLDEILRCSQEADRVGEGIEAVMNKRFLIKDEHIITMKENGGQEVKKE